MGNFLSKKMTWRQAWREADVRCQTSVPPHLTTWRQSWQLRNQSRFVCYNGENERYTEELKWCRCYEGQRGEICKIEDVNVPHTLGWVSYILLVKFVFLRKVVRLFGAEVQKPRNLSTHESEECEHGKGVGVYPTLLQSDTLYYYIHMFAEEQGQACDRKRLFIMDR